MKTSDLIGPALDWAVAKASGLIDKDYRVGPTGHTKVVVLSTGRSFDMRIGRYFEPSTDWSQGGPLVERVKIDIVWEEGQPHARMSQMVQVPRGVMSWCTTKGPTPLIAAMRCLVASRLGDEVDVPKELL